MKVINLTQHDCTPAQLESVEELPAGLRAEVRALLTFDSIPEAGEMDGRAARLAEIAAGEGADGAMVGGAPFFMETLCVRLREAGVAPRFAFSLRRSREVVREDGAVEKVAVFEHGGFVNCAKAPASRDDVDEAYDAGYARGYEHGTDDLVRAANRRIEKAFMMGREVGRREASDEGRP